MITLPFQKKNKEKEYKEKKRETKEKKNTSLKKKNTKKVSSKLPKKEKGTKIGKSKIAYRVLKEPIISEKSTSLSEEGKYIFKVFPNANKKDIKKAIEDIYKIKVKKVNIINIVPKKKRLGRQEGWKSGYKKAIISLEAGEKIDLTSR